MTDYGKDSGKLQGRSDKNYSGLKRGKVRLSLQLASDKGKMGNIYSENQLCDCASTTSSFSRKARSGSSSGQEMLTTEIVKVDNHTKGRTGNCSGKARRVRSHSISETDMVKAKGESGQEYTHRYHLRSRDKEGFRMLDKLNGGQKKGTAKRFSNELQQLPQSLEKLSLVNTGNEINVDEDKAGVRGKSQKKVEMIKTDDNLDLPKHVLYYGWFFSPETSCVIHSVVMHYFHTCYDQVPQFQRFMTTCCKDAGIRDPFEYYKRPGKQVKPDDPLEYHVTSKFLGSDPDPPYQSLVHPFLEKSFYIHLIGIMFTPRTLGVRVKLSPAQQLIFDEKDDSRNRRKLETASNDPSDQTHEIQNLIHEEINGYKNSHKIHKRIHPNCKLKMKPTDQESPEKKEGIIFKRFKQNPTTMTTKSRAHITIGCAPNVRPLTTGDDLVDIIDLEQRQATTSDSNFQQDFHLERGVLRQFGKHANAFVIYSDTEMAVPARFNAFI